MPNVASPGFGGNVDNIAGSLPGVTLSQLEFGSWRARSIYGGSAGAIIQSVSVTPRDPTSAGPKFPTAGFFTLAGFFSNVALDASNQFFDTTDKLRTACLGGEPFFQMTRSNQAATDLNFAPHGIYVKPNTFAHIICIQALTAAGAGISSFYDLTVTGRYLESDGAHYKLR